MKLLAKVLVITGASFFISSQTWAANWEVTRDFNNGALGAKAERKADGFDEAAGGAVYSSIRSIDGGRSAQLSVNKGTEGFGYWGGIINFPSKLAVGQELWLQLYIYIPPSFVIKTPTNGSLKFIRIATQNASGKNAGYNDIQLFDDGNQSNSFRMLKEGQAQWFKFGAANTFAKGAWQRVSVNMKLGTTPKAQGGTAQVRVWQNGKLLTDGTGMKTLVNASDVASAFYLFTYWNGTAPQTQSLWVDKIQFANFKPAWAGDLEGVSSNVGTGTVQAPPAPPVLQVR